MAENKTGRYRKVEIDESLFVSIGEDDIEAFETLYHLTERTMYAYILSIVKNHDDTLDILQDTYLKIRSAAHLYKPMGKPLAWMFTIARNLSLSKLRLENRMADMENLDMENSLQFSYVTDPEDRIVLMAALKVLAEDERKIILLHAVSGMKHREIAENVGIPLSTALSKYHRGLKKLRKYLQDKGGVR
ncbi:MAG: RNA polymerase sigma factor [Desulfitobacterium sp.]|nr:RNA polymerase sigma factor [Desulfitobacterium sp.]